MIKALERYRALDFSEMPLAATRITGAEEAEENILDVSGVLWLTTRRLLFVPGRLELGSRQPVDPDPVLAAPRDALEDPGHRLRRTQRAGRVALSQGRKIEGVVRLQHHKILL